MKKEISKESRQELTAAIRQRYERASKQDKSRILDEFVSLTGYHRKHAIRVLSSNDRCTSVQRPIGKRIYDEAVKEALIVLWEAADRICGKRLKAVLPVFINTMERNGHLDLDPEVRIRLLQMRPSCLFTNEIRLFSLVLNVSASISFPLELIAAAEHCFEPTSIPTYTLLIGRPFHSSYPRISLSVMEASVSYYSKPERETESEVVLQ